MKTGRNAGGIETKREDMDWHMEDSPVRVAGDRENEEKK